MEGLKGVISECREKASGSYSNWWTVTNIIAIHCCWICNWSIFQLLVWRKETVCCERNCVGEMYSTARKFCQLSSRLSMSIILPCTFRKLTAVYEMPVFILYLARLCPNPKGCRVRRRVTNCHLVLPNRRQREIGRGRRTRTSCQRLKTGTMNWPITFQLTATIPSLLWTLIQRVSSLTCITKLVLPCQEVC